MAADDYPPVLDPANVGTYDPLSKAGGGSVWDEVLENRVWCHPGGDDYYEAFASLVLQREHINEPTPGEYEHVTTERITEWPVEFLLRPRRTEHTIPDFLAADAPPNRFEILRGTARSPRDR